MTVDLDAIRERAESWRRNIDGSQRNAQALSEDVLALVGRIQELEALVGEMGEITIERAEARAVKAEAELAAEKRQRATLQTAYINAEEGWSKAEAERDTLRAALAFYADPESYFGIGMFPDRPCGKFIEDFSEVPWPDGGTNFKPGKRARAALTRGAGDDGDYWTRQADDAWRESRETGE